MSKLIRLLSIQTGLTEQDVERIINRAPDTYKSYTIPKRNGKGNRVISQPAREVKVLQRVLTERLRSLPIHDAAMAYRKGIPFGRTPSNTRKTVPSVSMTSSLFSRPSKDWIGSNIACKTRCSRILKTFSGA